MPDADPLLLGHSPDCCTSSAPVPQWKRELLQRRAARCCPAPPPPPPLPSAPSDEDEELRYGPGIVNRLKSRYLSLALRERRPSVLRRAASLEHLLDRPPPAPAAPPPSPPPPPVPLVRRDHIKRARSVDALSRLERADSCEERPRPVPRAPRPPRRARPLLADAERPPPDVVRAALRKFESAPSRPRPAPAARVSGVLRGLARTPPRSAPAATQTTPSLKNRTSAAPAPAPVPAPEPRARSPSPAPPAVDSPVIQNCRDESPARTVSRAALDGIARAGATVRYSFENGGSVGAHLPSVAAANPVLLGRARLTPAPRQVGVIRPMPAQQARDATPPPHESSPPRKPSARAPPPTHASVSVVFNFSSRKEVPDYIENDGLALRRHGHVRQSEDECDSEAEAEGEGEGAPCRVRFINDNVLINGRSNLRQHSPRTPTTLKLQFDDSLTRTFEYPAEWSAGEETAAPAYPAHPARPALGSYTPSKMLLQDPASAFQLGVTRPPTPPGRCEEACGGWGECEPPPPSPPAPARLWTDSPHLDLLF